MILPQQVTIDSDALVAVACSHAMDPQEKELRQQSEKLVGSNKKLQREVSTVSFTAKQQVAD